MIKGVKSPNFTRVPDPEKCRKDVPATNVESCFRGKHNERGIHGKKCNLEDASNRHKNRIIISLTRSSERK